MSRKFLRGKNYLAPNCKAGIPLFGRKSLMKSNIHIILDLMGSFNLRVRHELPSHKLAVINEFVDFSYSVVKWI
jgi:hypothetical protein